MPDDLDLVLGETVILPVSPKPPHLRVVVRPPKSLSLLEFTGAQRLLDDLAKSGLKRPGNGDLEPPSIAPLLEITGVLSEF